MAGGFCLQPPFPAGKKDGRGVRLVLCPSELEAVDKEVGGCNTAEATGADAPELKEMPELLTKPAVSPPGKQGST